MIKIIQTSFFLLATLSFTSKLNAQEGGYIFDASKIKRDPFRPSKELTGSKNMLTSFDVTRFQLVAILTGMGSPRAMLSLPNKETETVRIGDKIGKNSGVIHRINDSEVVIKESYKDYLGKERSHFTSLVIAD